MLRTFKSYALAGAAALALAAIAQEALAQAAKPAESQSAVTATSNQIVVRDGNSGQLRAASPEEAATLREQHAAGRLRAAAPQSTLPRYHASGARGARLTDEFMSYSVVVRQPDGSLTEFCFESREAAEAALKSPPVVVTQTLPTE